MPKILTALLMICALALGEEAKPAAATKTDAKDVKLTPSASEAQALAKDWSEGGLRSPVSMDREGRVKYAYGSDMPTVVCAPLRVCTIELEPGEQVTGELQLGDSVRWTYTLMFYGTANGAPGQTPVIALKPTPVARETNLLVTTDRRVYYVRLVPADENYMPRVSFTYPEDDANKWRQSIKANEPPPPAPVSLPAATVNRDDVERQILETLNLNYDWKGGRKTPCLKPLRVFDDGVHTIIQMPSCINARELPVLLVHADGKDIVTNYRVVDSKFVVDRLFDRAVLRAGASKEAIKDAVHIEQRKAVSNGKAD